VSGISSGGGGWRMRWRRAATTRKAWASMARVTQRYQQRQRRTWCWSRPARPLPAWMGFLDAPALAGDLDQAGQRDRAGCGAVVGGQLAGGAAATDHSQCRPGWSAGVGRSWSERRKAQSSSAGPWRLLRLRCPATLRGRVTRRRGRARRAVRRGLGRRPR
jgi:hypothetical protein